MLLRILTLALVFVVGQFSSAQDSSTTRTPTFSPPPMAAPAPQPPHPALATSDSPASTHTANDVPREQQQRLLQVKIAELDRLQREVDQLRAATGTPQQILVKVQMLEVSLTKLRRLGMDVAWFTNGQGKGVNVPAQNPATGLVAHIESGNAFVGFIDSLKQDNIAKALAEPSVVVVSGRPASFNTGGEFPLPSNDGSKSAAEYRKFGTELDLTALAVGNNKVRLHIRTRISEIDDTHAIEIKGVRLPRLSVRECTTATEMSFGQTAVLTGLIEKRTEANRNALGLTKGEQVEVGMLLVITPETIAPLEIPAAAAREANRTLRP